LCFVKVKGQNKKTQEKREQRAKSRKLMIGYAEFVPNEGENLLSRKEKEDYVTFSYVFREKVR